MIHADDKIGLGHNLGQEEFAWTRETRDKRDKRDKKDTRTPGWPNGFFETPLDSELCRDKSLIE